MNRRMFLAGLVALAAGCRLTQWRRRHVGGDCSCAAITIPFRNVPSAHIIGDQRYEVRFERICTPKFAQGTRPQWLGEFYELEDVEMKIHA